MTSYSDPNIPAKKSTPQSDRAYYLFALRIIGDFGASIAVPVVVLAMLGQWLDGRYGTAPYLTLAGFVLAALGSGAMMYRKAKKYGEQYQQLTKKTKL